MRIVLHAPRINSSKMGTNLIIYLHGFIVLFFEILKRKDIIFSIWINFFQDSEIAGIINFKLIGFCWQLMLYNSNEKKRE